MFKVTVCELDCSSTYKNYLDNLPKSDLILLPEMPAYFWFPSIPYFNKTIWQEALKVHDEFINSLKHSIKRGMLIATRPVQEELRLNQAFCYCNNYKPIRNKYYFPNERGFYEARWFQKKEKDFKVFKFKKAVVGVLICTELMFNELARQYGRQNAHIIVVPRATTNLRKWKVALQMAAIVSGSFVITSNRIGEIGFNDFGCVVNPEGEIIANTSNDDPFITVKINLKEAEKAKKVYPRNVQED